MFDLGGAPLSVAEALGELRLSGSRFSRRGATASFAIVLQNPSLCRVEQNFR